MATYRLTMRARQNVLRIWRRLADDNQSAAVRFVDLLAVARDQLRSGYRSFPVGEYLILYRIKEPGVQIMHIVHSRRDLETLFGQ